MKTQFFLCTAASILLLSGCGTNKMGVAPSHNTSLLAVSPGDATKGGAMQRSLDSWLKEEWSPMTASEPVVKTTTATDGTVTQIKTEVIPSATATADGKIANMTSTQVTTTTITAPDGKVTTTTTTVAEPVDETPFTLQKYADMWKAYNDKKAKMNEGKPKEPSHLDTMKNMPVIGK